MCVRCNVYHYWLVKSCWSLYVNIRPSASKCHVAVFNTLWCREKLCVALILDIMIMMAKQAAARRETSLISSQLPQRTSVGVPNPSAQTSYLCFSVDHVTCLFHVLIFQLESAPSLFNLNKFYCQTILKQ